jgi:orotidine-5'-phosphate decarboxylase
VNPRDRLIVALDVEGYDPAAAMVERLSPDVLWYKIGATLFSREGPRVCRLVKEAGGRLFLDLKYHDIPNTVAGAVTSAMTLDCDMLTLHTSGGVEMMRRAREAAEAAGKSDVIIVGVTVLTSFAGETFVEQFASNRNPQDMVVSLAGMAREAGITGVVASAQELRLIKDAMGADFVVVTPGIRLPDAGKDDQTRVVTPEAAVRDGADYIVVGRPIIAAPDPAEAARHILDRMASA